MIKKNWSRSSKCNISKIVFTFSFAMLINIGTAHAESSIDEKNEEVTLIDQYKQIQNNEYDADTVLKFVEQLNQRIEVDSNDVSAWELLAKIYYQNEDIEYAVFAANEAIDLGSTDEELPTILLKGSTTIASTQINDGYVNKINDKEFLEQYQSVLSKVYGTMHGFNYNEALPKRKAKVRVKKTTKKYTPKRRVVRKPRTVVKPKPRVRPKNTSKPTVKPRPRTPSTKSSTSDPFKILR